MRIWLSSQWYGLTQGRENQRVCVDSEFHTKRLSPRLSTTDSEKVVISFTDSLRLGSAHGVGQCRCITSECALQMDRAGVGRMHAITIPVIAGPIEGEVNVPGSKSITNRALLVAALAEGKSVIESALFSEDVYWFVDCLSRLGFSVKAMPELRRIEVDGLGGGIPAKRAELFVGNAGTAARFITALVCLGKGEYRLDGVPRMRARPIGDLISALRGAGGIFAFEEDFDHFPFTVRASGFKGGSIEVRADKTSQQLSALLLVAPYAHQDTTVRVIGPLVSGSYVNITRRVMTDFGVTPEVLEPGVFRVAAPQRYSPKNYTVEPDASNASYFYAAAAVTGGKVRVRGLSRNSVQGDIRFVDVLGAMGCEVHESGGDIEIKGPAQLRGIEVDLQDMSDMVQTLAAIAPFASSPVMIRNVEHIRLKETERIRAVVTELRRLGARVDELTDGLVVYPSELSAATVETYDDHRMAMAFAVTGLRVPGLAIKHPECTRKTFPEFFSALFRLMGKDVVLPDSMRRFESSMVASEGL